MRFQDTPFSASQNDGKHIFVFGSNLAGRHGKGAALEAKKHWGAKQGAGDGWRGLSYAIPTKGHHLEVLSLKEIECDIRYFIDFTVSRPALTFLITRIGCGLAGYKDADIAPMFKTAPDNCVFQKEWEPYLK